MNALQHDYLFKVLFIGDSGTGKSSLILRFVDDSFNTSFISTIGVDFKIKTVDVEGMRIKMQIWDTAGQERFRTIVSSYYRGAHGIVVVYDVTERQSFSKIQHWLKEIENYGTDEIIKLIVGNKCDLSDKRMVDFASAKEFADELDIPIMEASARSNINVDEIFFKLARDILGKIRIESSGHKPNNTGVKIEKPKEKKKERKCCYISVE